MAYEKLFRIITTATSLVWAGGTVCAQSPLEIPRLQETLPGPQNLPPPVHPDGPVVLDVPYDEIIPGDDLGLVPNNSFPECFCDLWAPRPWFWQLLPNNLIYTSYLAGTKEPRIGTVWYDDTAAGVIDPSRQEGWL
ncbi:MAG: hypothetical protein ABGW78_05720, partial [Pirellulales bacterium]